MFENWVKRIAIRGANSNEANVNTDGSLNTANVAQVSDVVLQNAATAVGNGTAITVGTTRTLTLEVTGTATSRTIVFEGASTSGTYYSVMGIRLSDMASDVQTTGNNEVWQFDVTGLVSFRARISAIAGGNMNVKGKGVAY